MNRNETTTTKYVAKHCEHSWCNPPCGRRCPHIWQCIIYTHIVYGKNRSLQRLPRAMNDSAKLNRVCSESTSLRCDSLISLSSSEHVCVCMCCVVYSMETHNRWRSTTKGRVVGVAMIELRHTITSCPDGWPKMHAVTHVVDVGARLRPGTIPSHPLEPTNERHYCVNINVASRTDEENTFTNFRFKQYTKNTCVILRIDKGVLNVTAHFWLSFCFSFTFRLDPSLWVGRVRRTTERYTFLPLFECNCRRYGWI